MKKYILFLLMITPVFLIAQEHLKDDIYFNVYINYPPFSMSKDSLSKANKLIDLNRRYKENWVREYLSVEVAAYQKGKLVKAFSADDYLTKQQKEIITNADPDKKISILVKYMPENTLKQNTPKEMGFKLAIDPDHEAEYPGGKQQLKKYLKEQAIDKIPTDGFEGFDLATIKFTISKSGELTDVYVFWPTEHKEIEEMLVKSIENMPKWKPAQSESGIIVPQEFVLTVGNMQSCVINLLNIREKVN
ncbi:MAG: energy transducer TonB [Bacteroidota bacterium]